MHIQNLYLNLIRTIEVITQNKRLSSMDRLRDGKAGISLGIRPANERCRYIVTTSLIGWVHTYLNWSLEKQKYSIL